MPIRPENRDRYPPDWPDISARVRQEAGNRCEWCRAPNGETIARGRGDDAGTYMLERGETYDDKTGEYLGLRHGSEYDAARFVRVILTVAHMDHHPENCERENLKALCQKCHNAYDAPMRRRGIAERQKAKCATGDLFSTETAPAEHDDEAK